MKRLWIPLSPSAWFLIDQGEEKNVQWFVVINGGRHTGQFWIIDNSEVRACRNWTLARAKADTLKVRK